ncbi:uncharacterized protein [Solanum lycopersicum]|uniref:Uncharacterized protein n=1 Tax=Solanum lycopersicum TaxID=4081 RepID=K4CAI7_SOLLC|nr:uncharacterized protein LOC109120536 [Solanum lycopersicum]
MSEDKRENGQNKKQKMKSAVQEEEEYKPIMQELFSQTNTNFMIPIFLDTIESANRSTDLFPLQNKYIEQGEEIPSSVAVEANQSSKVLLSKRKRSNLETVEELPKGSMEEDSENDFDSINLLIRLVETCLELNSEDDMEM